MPFLANSRHIGRVWLSLAQASVVRELEFRRNFWLGILRQMLWLASFLFIIHVIFRNTPTLSGWSQTDVVIILALSRLIEGSMHTLFTGNVVQLPELIRSGKFDAHLLRPLPSQFSVAFHRVGIYSLGNVVAGVVLLGYALLQRGQLPSVTEWLAFVALVLMGVTLFYCLIITVATLAFYLERLEALWGFIMLFSEPLTVPFDIFPRPAQIGLTYFLPLAFVVFIPAQALTNRLTSETFLIGLALTGLFILLARLAWRMGLRRYTSASS